MSKDGSFYTLKLLETGYEKYFDLCGFTGFYPCAADCVSIHKMLSVHIVIAFDLRCDQDHTFEAWFQDGQAYETQREKGLLTCPVCGSNRVQKIPSAVAVCKRYMGKDGCTSEAVLNEVLNNLYTIVKENTEDVGAAFAKEALKIHYGVIESRNIRGVATPDEEKILKEEGISFMKIPVPEKISTKGH